MKPTFFDACTNITNRIGLDNANEELVSVLDNMLTEHGIEHAFMWNYPEKIDEIEDKGHEYCITLLYQAVDDTKLRLVYTLWLVEYRNANEALVRRYFHRFALKHRKEDKETLKTLDRILQEQADKNKEQARVYVTA